LVALLEPTRKAVEDGVAFGSARLPLPAVDADDVRLVAHHHRLGSVTGLLVALGDNGILNIEFYVSRLVLFRRLIGQQGQGLHGLAEHTHVRLAQRLKWLATFPDPPAGDIRRRLDRGVVVMVQKNSCAGSILCHSVAASASLPFVTRR
jgi:hypothetical protein